jgi:CheY-like chemotaxis protein
MLNQANSDDHAGVVARNLGIVLLVEDDGLLAMMLEDLVREAGAASVIVGRDPQDALRAAEQEPLACAILDVAVWGTSTIGIADILASRNIPFLFCTGFTANDIEERHRQRPLLAKPYSDDQFKAALATTLGW